MLKVDGDGVPHGSNTSGGQNLKPAKGKSHTSVFSFSKSDSKSKSTSSHPQPIRTQEQFENATKQVRTLYAEINELEKSVKIIEANNQSISKLEAARLRLQERKNNQK